MEEKLNELKALVSQIEIDQDKFLRTGSKPATIRIRKSLQDVRSLAKEYRDLAVESRNKRAEENK